MSVDSSQWKNLPSDAEQAPTAAEIRAFPAPPPPAGAPAATQGGCEVCGRGPAEWFAVRRHVGMLFAQRFVSAKVYMCRDHATEVIKSYLGKTLVHGWWGIISFFVNFVAIAQDLVALRNARKMPAPTS
ncbi:MAG: hypothetical protein ACJ76P_06060 [Actinomycetota bacterium]